MAYTRLTAHAGFGSSKWLKCVETWNERRASVPGKALEPEGFCDARFRVSETKVAWLKHVRCASSDRVQKFLDQILSPLDSVPKGCCVGNYSNVAGRRLQSFDKMDRRASLFPTSYDAAAKYKIDHAGRVSREVFQTVAAFFFALATIAFLGRVGVRLVVRKRFLLDDYVLLFGYCGLVASTALIYRFCHLIFILNALKYDRTVIPTLEDLKTIGRAQAVNYSLLAVVWTAICSVKLCFLASLKALIANVSFRITVWYWIAVSLSIITWFLAWTISFMICPYVGDELLKHCTPETPFVKTLALSILVTFLDIVTDIMIVTIPIWILRAVRISLKQKFAIGVFLCLSFVMIAIAITRMAAHRHDGWDDLTWEYLVLYLQACIAVLMASIAAFRSVFVEHKRRQQEEQLRLNDLAAQQDAQRPENLRGRIGRMRAKAKHDEFEDSVMGNTSYLPRAKLDGPKLKGLTTFINNFGNRSQMSKSSSSRTMGDTLASVDAPTDDSWMNTTKASTGTGQSSTSYYER